MIIEALIGAIAYRIRGGMIGQLTGRELPNFPERAVWCLYITLMLPISYLSPAIFILAYVGCMLGYFDGQFDLSRKENRTWKNYALLSARGAWTMLPLAICFGLLYPQLLFGVLAGLSFVPCYLAGVLIAKKCKVQGHSQWGEWLYGMAIGASL